MLFILAGCESGAKLTTNSVNDEIAVSKNKTYSSKQSPGKSSAAIEMEYTLDKNIVANKESEVIITFRTKKDVDNLLVNFKLDSGLVSTDAEQVFSFGVLASGEKSVVKLRVSAASNGYYYINVLATLVSNNKQSRSFSIPINVGNVNAKNYLKSKGNVKIDASGRRIISMPAQMPNNIPDQLDK